MSNQEEWDSRIEHKEESKFLAYPKLWCNSILTFFSYLLTTYDDWKCRRRLRLSYLKRAKEITKFILSGNDLSLIRERLEYVEHTCKIQDAFEV